MSERVRRNESSRSRPARAEPPGDPEPDPHLAQLRERLQDPEFRKIPGFPRGADETILGLSDPPRYTACPNPFLTAFIQGGPPDHPEPIRTPWAGPLTARTRHPVARFHPYHTKVPPELIRLLIEHYTAEGELVLDPFAGSGMTGVAARECNRRAVLCDLSPLATFLAALNTHGACRGDWPAARRQLEQLIDEVEAELGWLYATQEDGQLRTINYCVWSDVFTCPACGCEFPFFPHGVLRHRGKVETRRTFPCPGCQAELNIRRVVRVRGPAGKRRELVWVDAGTGRQRHARPPNEDDLALAREQAEASPTAWHPTDPIDPERYSARLAQLGAKQITEVSRLLTPRNLQVYAQLWSRAQALPRTGIRQLALGLLTSIFTVVSERQGYFGGGGGMSGNLYMPVVRMERNVFHSLRRALRRAEAAEAAKTAAPGEVCVTTQSATALAGIPDASIDFVFTDPPFGANLIYSELNQPLEAWLRLRTADDQEAVIDPSRARTAADYASLLGAAFRECFRVLKPGRWLTVEFHNTHATVWNQLQTCLGEAGFVVAQVGLLDKGNTTILADIRPTATRGDLLVSAHKPTAALRPRFALEPGQVRTVVEFLREHLAQLPAASEPGGPDPVQVERQSHRLYDRVVAYHVQRGIRLPLSASEFQQLLARTFVCRDGRYYLTELPEP